MTASSLTPMLTVKNAVAAVDFYVSGRRREALLFDRLEGGDPEAFNLSPASLGGTTVRMNLIVHDPDATATRAIAAGASEIFPVNEQPYGFRQGRVADPDGHHWLIGKPLVT